MAERKGKGAGEKTDQSILEKMGINVTRALFNKIKDFESTDKKVLKQLIQGQTLSHADNVKMWDELKKVRDGLDSLVWVMSDPSAPRQGPKPPAGHSEQQRNEKGQYTASETKPEAKPEIPKDPTLAAHELIKQLAPGGAKSLSEVAATLHDQLLSGKLTLEQVKSMSASLSQTVKVDGRMAAIMADLQKTAKDSKSKDAGTLLAILAAVKDHSIADTTEVEMGQMRDELSSILKLDKRNTERQEKKDREKDTHLLGNRGLGILTGIGGGQGINSLGDISNVVTAGVSVGLLLSKVTNALFDSLDNILDKAQTAKNGANGVPSAVAAENTRMASLPQNSSERAEIKESKKAIKNTIEQAAAQGLFGSAHTKLTALEVAEGAEAYTAAKRDKKSPKESIFAAGMAIYNVSTDEFGVSADPGQRVEMMNHFDELYKKFKPPESPKPIGTPSLSSLTPTGSLTPKLVGAATADVNRALSSAPGKETSNFIRGFEETPSKGSVATYLDPTGSKTSGIGHLVKPGEKAPGILTREQAEAQFNQDLASHEKESLRGLKVPITENQKAAIVSLGFNAGPGVAQQVVKKLNAGDVQGAAAVFARPGLTTSKGIQLPGLVRRRAAEKSLFETPTPTVTAALPLGGMGKSEVTKSGAPEDFSYFHSKGSYGAGVETSAVAHVLKNLSPDRPFISGVPIPKVSPTAPVNIPDSDISKKAADIKVQESRNRSTPTAQISPRGSSNNSLPAPGTPKTTGVDDLALAILKNGMLESV